MNSSATPIWSVVSQVEQIRPNPAGGVVMGKVITVKVNSSGTLFTVFVPDANYTIDSVRQAITQAYDQVVGVDNLSGGA